MDVCGHIRSIGVLAYKSVLLIMFAIMKTVKAAFFGLIIMLLTQVTANAQCAMCRATLETNVSNGSETVLAANLNFGILYLFAAPYLTIAAVAFFWYKHSKKSKIPAWFIGFIFVRRYVVLILVDTIFANV